MTLPLVTMDIVLFAVFMATLLATGVFIGWKILRKTNEILELLNIISRTDHFLDSYIVSIQGTAKKVLGKDFPVDSADVIIQLADQMERYVERLRQVRRGLDPDRKAEPVNLARTIDKIQVNLAQAATDRNIILGRVEIHGSNRLVTADPLMIEEIFTTLLDNAIKHNPPGTQVVAELSRSEDMALVRISDNGKGIKPDLLPNIFEMGGKDNDAGAAPGSGMGLFIARTLTEIHGGNISVESELGKSSIFSVELPFEYYRANDLSDRWFQRALWHARHLQKRVLSLPRIR